MINSETTKTVLLSILNLGESSHLFNQFYKICIHLSVATLNLSKNQIVKNELLQRMDCSAQDLACDCIWKLFVLKNGRLVEFEKYFQKYFPIGIETIHPDYLKARLAILIKARTQQGLSFIREEWGENYFSIRKAISTEIRRTNSSYAVHNFNKKKYISLNHRSVIDFNFPQIEKDFLLSELYLIKMIKYDYAKILRSVFEILNSHAEFCKAIEEKLLLNTLKEFYCNKLNDFIELNQDLEYKNVEYITFEEDSSLNSIENTDEYERD